MAIMNVFASRFLAFNRFYCSCFHCFVSFRFQRCFCGLGGCNYIYVYIYCGFFFFCLARGTLFSDGISLSLSFSFSFSFMTVQKWIRSGISTSATRF
jgi:hypothetical protein